MEEAVHHLAVQSQLQEYANLRETLPDLKTHQAATLTREGRSAAKEARQAAVADSKRRKAVAKRSKDRRVAKKRALGVARFK